MQTFEQAYKRLNTAQKDAVDSIEGPVMVIAGPGTGKTQILTLRIANILQKTDTPANGILALTFTESGVSAIRERLAQFIGSRAYEVHIHTFHGFATYLSEVYPDALSRLNTGVLVDEVAQYDILQKGFDKLDTDLLSTLAQPYRAIGKVLHFIRNAKRESWTPEKLSAYYDAEEKRITESGDFKHIKGAHKGKIKAEHIMMLKKIKKSKQAVLMYEFYEKYLNEHSLFDFEDQLLEIVKAFESDEEFMQMVQEQFLYVLADEHQDANATQNAILTHIGDFHDSPNLFVVGDEKQAIYRFQGAELDTFLSLKEKFSDTKVITLETNYRSTQEVLDAAHQLISPAPIPDPTLRKELSAHNGSGKEVSISVYESLDAEMEGIVSFITEKIEEGAKYEDITILVRKNAQALPIAEKLGKQKIPFYRATNESFLDHPFAVLLLHLFTFLWKGSSVDLAQVLFIPGLVSVPDRLRLIAGSRVDLLEMMGDESRLRELGIEDVAGVLELHNKLVLLSEHAHVLPLVRIAPMIINELNIIPGILKSKSETELYHVLENVLHDVESVGIMHEKYTILDYLNRINLIKEHSIKLERKASVSGGVKIMTLHKAKGLEFPYVIIPFVSKGAFDRKMGEEFLFPGSEKHDAHDARRLLYVAVTRAEKEACISYATTNASGRSENKSELLCSLEGVLEEIEKESKETPLIVRESGNTSLADPAFILERLRSMGISATAYGTYRDSPWNYFFRNIVRLPQGKSIPLLYGNAIHAALEYVGTEHFKGVEIDVEKVVDVFVQALTHSFLTKEELKKYLPRGEKLLREYVSTRIKLFASEGFVELDLSYSLDVPGVGPITVRGKLDRVDIIDGKHVRVVDYKTGKTYTKNSILGKTKGGRTAYYTQIMFYALLLYRNEHKKMTMDEGVIEFVEPNDKGNFISHTFPIAESDVLTFEKQLVSDLESIAKGEFLQNPCDPAIDAYCDLVSLLSE